MPATLDRDIERETQTTDGQDRDRQSHYVKHDELERAMLNGEPATALCGKKWLPTRDPKRYPVCQTCKEIFAKLPPGE